MKYIIKLFFSVICCVSFFSPSALSLDEGGSVDLLGGETKELKESLLAELESYQYWWNSLSPQQQSMLLTVDRVEESHKYNNFGMPIDVTDQNIKKMCQIVGVRKQTDVILVEKRMRQHIENTIREENIQKFEKSVDSFLRKLK